MTIEVGQIYKRGLEKFEILGVGNELVLFRFTSAGNEDTRSVEHVEKCWELVKPWFEVGQVHKWPSGTQYTIHSLAERDGVRSAVGWYETSWSKGFAILEENDYDAARIVK